MTARTLTQLDPEEAVKMFYGGHPLAFMDEPGSPFVCGQWMGQPAYITPLPFTADTAAQYFTDHPVMLAPTSVEAPTVPGAPPVNAEAPVIRQAMEGNVDEFENWHDTVLTTQGIWADPQPTSFYYQWRRDGSNVGTSSQTYVVGSNDVGHAFDCVVTGFNDYGSTPVTSNQIGIVGSRK